MADKEGIEYSRGGIKTTLLAFISDHSTSLFLLSFFIVSYYFPVFGQPLNKYKTFGLSTENKIFIGVIVLLALHPIGLIINAFSWMTLGWAEKWSETQHFKHSNMFNKGSKDYLCFDILKSYYSLTKDNFYETARLKEYELMANHPDKLNNLDDVLGNNTLLRNLGFLSIILTVVYIFLGYYIFASLSLLITLIITFINSAVSFFYSLSILMIYYSLYKPQTNP